MDLLETNDKTTPLMEKEEHLIEQRRPGAASVSLGAENPPQNANNDRDLEAISEPNEESGYEYTYDSLQADMGVRLDADVGQTPPQDLSMTTAATTLPGGAAAEDDASSAQLGPVDSFVSSIASIFPKVEPLPWTTYFSLLFWCTIPVVGYILLFTQMGYGEGIYFALSQRFKEYSNILAGGLGILLFFFYILDIDEWRTAVGSIFRFLIVIFMFVVFLLLIMVISENHPYGIISLFAVLNPLWLLVIKTLFYRHMDTRIFVSWLSSPLFSVAILNTFAFLGWVISDSENKWNDVTKVESALHTGCPPNFDEYPNCRSEAGSNETCFSLVEVDSRMQLYYPEGCSQICINVYSDCLNGFILWVGPVLMSLSLVFLSFFCTFLRSEGTDEDDIFNFGKIWIFILCIMWISASLAGTAAGVTSSLVALTLASFVASAILISASFSRNERKDSKEAVLARVRAKYGKHLDFVRGLFVVTCAPITMFYIILSMINQLVRRVGINPCSQSVNSESDPGEKLGFLTVRTRKQINWMKSWNRAKVFTYAIYWGMAYMILQVMVAKLTVVFFSWLIEATSDFGLYAVTGIMSGVGILMFLLPPVPGVPVYLTLGIVLAAQGHETLGWFGSIGYSIAVGLILKLVSSAMQQKLIGENLSHYVKVRQFVSINSKIMRAMRLVLGKNGFSISKVAILIGGPDWPTSVLCGIMRLKLLQIMIGTSPIVFLIAPTSISGALLYMSNLQTDTGNPEFPWAGTAATITAAMTAVVQFGSVAVAAYYLEQASEKRAAEIEVFPIDQEVKEADDRDAHMRKCYDTVTQWRSIPVFWKLILLSSLGTIIASCYLVQFFSTMCFREHALTDSISENLDGRLANLFLPLGWIATGLFLLSWLLLHIFFTWGKRQARKLATSAPISSLPDSTEPILDNSADVGPDATGTITDVTSSTERGTTEAILDIAAVVA